MARRVERLSLFLFALVLSSVPAQAAPISLDNDVEVNWSNNRCFPEFNLFACPHDATVIGGVRLFTPDELADLEITVDLHTAANEVEGINLFLNVGDASLEQILVSGSPLVLTTGVLFGDAFGPFHIGDFLNASLLPTGVPLTFSLAGTLLGSSSFGFCNDGGEPIVLIIDAEGNEVPSRACEFPAPASTPNPATITFAGGTEVVISQVPEPTTLLLVAVGAGAGMRRLRRRRADGR